MGNKIDHASASGPRDALDLLIADPADCPILDDQAVRDILETGSYTPLDQATGDSDPQTDEADSVDNDAGNTGITSRVKKSREKAMLEEIIEGTKRRHRYQPKRD